MFPTSTPTPINAANPGLQELLVTVSTVIDGDTFEAQLADGSRQLIRLLGVDAPEIFHRNNPDEYHNITDTFCLEEWGHRATEFVADKLEGREVSLVLGSMDADKTTFGDTLALVMVEGQDLNATLVTLGYARVFANEGRRRQEEYLVLQQQAEQGDLGLWRCRNAPSSPRPTTTPGYSPGTQTIATAIPGAEQPASPSPTIDLAPIKTVTPASTPSYTPTPMLVPEAITAAELPPTSTPTPLPTVTPTPTSRPELRPTSTPLPKATPISVPSFGSIIIECIFFDGVVPTSEADEYVQIANLGSSTVNLVGWRLADVSDGAPEFTFPSLMLSPGVRVRVYTNERHPESGGLYFGRGSSIWNNSQPDMAGLFNSQGVQVSTRSYPPGCE